MFLPTGIANIGISPNVQGKLLIIHPVPIGAQSLGYLDGRNAVGGGLCPHIGVADTQLTIGVVAPGIEDAFLRESKALVISGRDGGNDLLAVLLAGAAELVGDRKSVV